MRNDTSRLRGLAEQILKLHKKGLSYKKIAKELGCSLSTVSYHLSKGQKETAKLRRDKQRLANKRYETNRWQYTGEVNPKHPLRKEWWSKVA